MPEFQLAGSRTKLHLVLGAAVPLLLVLAVWQSGIWRVANTKRRATVVLARNVQASQEDVSLADQLAAQDGSSDGSSDGSGGSDGGGPDHESTGQEEELSAAAAPTMSEEEAAARCTGIKAAWCKDFMLQRPVPARAPPRGDKTCLWGCNFVGQCDHMAGWCRCPAGWTGDDCVTRKRRPCSSRQRTVGSWEPYDGPTNVSLPAGVNARCAQLCDQDIGYCFCNSTWAHGHELARPDAPPGSPPFRRGRPLGFHCQPNKDDAGNPTVFGDTDPALLWGPEGWCQADQPTHRCPCILEGYGGPTCDAYVEHFCANQCSGHGECHMGFCKCHEGWWGHDCAYRTANNTDTSPGLEAEKRPWIKDVVLTPAAEDPEPGATRKRPLIYIYELPALFNQVMLQYRPDRGTCVHRVFGDSNETVWKDEWLYAAETGLHEALLQSEHRTLDPEEADFFYIPVYSSCYIYPIHGFNDSPFFHASHRILRVHAAVNMLIEVHAWIRSHHPYWDRNGGRDHIILQTHDEGSCWLPAVLRPAVLLTHWGRMDRGHRSNTGFGADNYSYDNKDPVYMPEGSIGKLGDFPCYNPEKDLVIPPLASPSKYFSSPLFGNVARERTILGFFKGRTQQENPPYSRGIRQKLENLCRDKDWWGKHGIFVGQKPPPDLESLPYSGALASSKFCFVLPGDGWSARLEDAVLHGCLPVIIQDEVHVAFESVLDFASFAIRIPQKDMHKIPQILEAVPQEKIEEMQRSLGKVWRRWIYTGYRPFRKLAKQLLVQNGAGQDKTVIKEAYKSYPHPENDYDPSQMDALETIMAWLHSRIPHTRGPLLKGPDQLAGRQQGHGEDAARRRQLRTSRREGVTVAVAAGAVG